MPKARNSAATAAGVLNKLTGQGSVQVVAKERVAANGEYNLSGERYREIRISSKTKWPVVELRHVCDKILSGGTPSTKKEEYWKGDIPWITSADVVDIKSAIPRKHITQDAIKESATNLIPKGNLIVVTRVNRPGIPGTVQIAKRESGDGAGANEDSAKADELVEIQNSQLPEP